jgi:hypothetical protein
VAAVAAAISLISQTYQIQGTFAQFMETWLLLSIPIVYLLRTSLGAVVYVVGAVVWLLARANLFGRWINPNLFWVLLLLVVPYFAACFRRDRHSRETAVVSLVFAIAATIGLGSTAVFAQTNLRAVAFAGLFSLIYICGTEFFPHQGGRLHPLALFGGFGIGVTAIVLSFEGVWKFVGAFSWRDRAADVNIAFAIEMGFPVAAILLLGYWLISRRRRRFSLTAGAFPIAAAIAWTAVSVCRPSAESYRTSCSSAAALLLNLYTLGLGIEFISRGIRAQSVARTNFGLAIVAGLGLARFFDDDFSFVTRGLGFIAVGAGFLIANIILFKRRAVA